MEVKPPKVTSDLSRILPEETNFNRSGLTRTEMVFINISAQGKRLVQNRSFCESTLKSVFFCFYKCYSQRVSVLADFFKKIDLFEKDRFF